MARFGSSPLDWLQSLGSDISTNLLQARHGVFNAQGRQVGYYDTLDGLCQGQWMLFKGETQPPASQLYVVDFWGSSVPVPIQCTRSAAANSGGDTSITYPQVVQPGSAITATAAANLAELGTPNDPTADQITGASLALPSLAQSNMQQWGTYALWGGLGLLAILIISGEGRGRA